MDEIETDLDSANFPPTESCNFIEDNFFEYFSKNGQERNWSIVILTNCLSFFLCTGTILDLFQISG